MWYDKQAVARKDTFERSNNEKNCEKFEKSPEKQLTRENSYAIMSLAHTRKGGGTELSFGSGRLKTE